MAEVVLVPMTSQDVEAFIDEEIADWADDRVLDGTWSRSEALDRARAALASIAAWERQAASSPTQRLWCAVTPGGERVGWVWVKLAPPGPSLGTAFLCQMTVARAVRHQGYGQATLAAVERQLAAEGIVELRLNVWESNLAAKALYAGAGYQLGEQYATMRQLRKRLDGGRAAKPSAAAS